MFRLRRTERAKRSCKPALEQLDVRVVPQATPVVSPIQTPPITLNPPGTPVDPSLRLFVKFDESGHAVASLTHVNPGNGTPIGTRQIFVPLQATTLPGPTATTRILAYKLPVQVTPGDVVVESLSGGLNSTNTGPSISDVLRFTSVESPLFNATTSYLEVFSDPTESTTDEARDPADIGIPGDISPFAPVVFENGIPEAFEEVNYQPTGHFPGLVNSESQYVFFSDGSPFSIFPD